MIRLIVFFLLLYLAFRLLRRILRPGRLKRPFPGAGSSGPVIDQMKPCAHCGTFVPSRQALEKKGLYFCDGRCLKKYTEAL